MQEDLVIIEGCKKGKRKFQDMLYYKYAPVLMGISLRYIHNRMEAEDVLHDALLKIYSNIRKFNMIDNGSFSGWMKRITVNTALNFLRDNKKHTFCLDVDEIDVIDNDFNDDVSELTEIIDTETVFKIIQSLPPGYSTVFNLYVFEKYTHQEIAQMLGINESTSKTQLFKARKMIRKKVEDVKKKVAILTA